MEKFLCADANDKKIRISHLLLSGCVVLKLLVNRSGSCLYTSTNQIVRVAQVCRVGRLSKHIRKNGGGETEVKYWNNWVFLFSTCLNSNLQRETKCTEEIVRETSSLLVGCRVWYNLVCSEVVQYSLHQWHLMVKWFCTWYQMGTEGENALKKGDSFRKIFRVQWRLWGGHTVCQIFTGHLLPRANWLHLFDSRHGPYHHCVKLNYVPK